VLGTSTFAGSERRVGLGVRDSLKHLHAIGPSGVGKSTLLLNSICQDMAAGRSVVVVEPKRDLIADVLARVPEQRLDDVVLIDPTDRTAVVGVNPLAAGERSPELVADQLLHVFHHLYSESWGPRLADILYSSLLTLARTPGSSLASLPLLLSDPAFRRRMVGRLDEPLVLQPFWQAFEAWSEAARAAAIAPILNKVRPLLVRPSLRAVLGQAQGFDLGEVFHGRKIVLVDLARGELGGEGAALLGAVVVSQLWAEAQRRSSVHVDHRHPVMVYLDEFQDYLSLPVDLADALAQARGLGVGLTLAHQHLAQLSPSVRAAVLANARSRVCFQLAADDARAFASPGSMLEAEDFASLPAFEAYAQLVAGDAVQPWFSLATHLPPPTCSDPSEVRRLSRERYGVPPAEVDRQLGELRRGNSPGDLEPKRREAGAE
jgi:hypothetical protein